MPNNNVKPIPEGFHTLTPSIVFKDTRKAIEFYKKALGARERMAMPGPDGKGIMHAEIQISDSIVMMNDEMPQCTSAQTLGGSPVSFFLYVPDADASFKKAVDAGATVMMPMQDAFWGDRWGMVTDPFGHTWSFATHKRDLAPEEMRKAAQEACAQMAAKKS
jgi:PhnB protein